MPEYRRCSTRSARSKVATTLRPVKSAVTELSWHPRTFEPSAIAISGRSRIRARLRMARDAGRKIASSRSRGYGGKTQRSDRSTTSRCDQTPLLRLRQRARGLRVIDVGQCFGDRFVERMRVGPAVEEQA